MPATSFRPCSSACADPRRPRLTTALCLLLLSLASHASAEVFVTRDREAPHLLAALRDEVALGPTLRRDWNGQALEMQQGRTHHAPGTLFDRVMTRVGAEPAPGVEHASQLDAKSLVARGHRRDGDGYSVLVRLPDRASDVASVAAGRVPTVPSEGPDRDGFMAMAIADGKGATDVLVTHIPREAPLLEIFGLTEGDVSGPDIEGIPRFPGTQRTLSFSEPGSDRAVFQVGYEGAGSVQEHADHYRRELLEAGMRELPVTTATDGPLHLRFQGATREVSVFVQPHPDGRRTVDLIQIRLRRDSR